jgi:hypothetical protein
VPIKDAHDLAESPHILRAASSISTVASSAYGLIVADMHGSVHVLSKEFEPVSSWVAHMGGRVTHMVERRGYLVTLGVGVLLVPPRTYPDDTNLDSIGRRRRPLSPSQNMAFREDRQEWHADVITLHQSADEQSATSGEHTLLDVSFFYLLLYCVLIPF